MMFSSGETARNGCGVVSPVLIPHRFFWPYGGSNVYVTGTFTRWTKHLRMTPVEGCPTVFQAICSLTPGYHEYKFFVDGEWRYDESKPCTDGNYGIVNTIVLGGQHDSAPEPSSPQSMDLDNETVRRVVKIPDGPHQPAPQRIVQADLDLSRRRLSEYMSTHTVYELLPDSGKVIVLDVDLPVKQAFHILYEQGIPMAPLWDFCKGQFVGVLSPSDFILILRELGKRGSNMSDEELEMHTISGWKEEKLRLSGQIAGFGRTTSRGLIHAGPYSSLKDVALKVLQHEVSTVPILYSSSSDGSHPQLLHLASLSGVLKCICRYFRSSPDLLPILQLPLCSIPLGTWIPPVGEVNRKPFAVLGSNAPLSSALNLLLQAQVSSIPVVDGNGSLVDVYSRSDITALAKDSAYARINIDELTVHQALQLGQETSSLPELSRFQMCLRTDPLFKVMERLTKPGVRRLVIVEPGSKRVEGIISLSDIFKFFLS